MKLSPSLWFAALPLAASLAGCPRDEELTLAEAEQAVEEAAIASQASNVAEGTIELATSFTLGGAVETAAEEIRAFAESQLPCAEVTLEGAKVTIDYGVTGDGCSYHGKTYTGSHSITVSRTAEDDVLVQHAWSSLSNGVVEVSGTANVTWGVGEATRHVVHDLAWTRLSDGRVGRGTGDRLQSGLDGAWANGVAIEGERRWDGDAGTWDLAIDGVEWRWVDPVPQAGSYELTTPNGKQLTLGFARVDDDTIRVTVEGARRAFEFDVTSLGQVQ
jgi:hypothetical protein